MEEELQEDIADVETYLEGEIESAVQDLEGAIDDAVATVESDITAAEGFLDGKTYHLLCTIPLRKLGVGTC